MASAAQILANQTNAQLSTGPTSSAGKARSATNATKHGLSSAFRVLPHEDQDEFDDLLDRAREDNEPATEHQAFLVEQMVKTHWLLVRAQRLEARAFEYLAGLLVADQSDPDSLIITKMFETNPNALTTLQRYAAQAEKSYYKAERELRAAQQRAAQDYFFKNQTRALARLNARKASANPPVQQSETKRTQSAVETNPIGSARPLQASTWPTGKSQPALAT
jgi:hypothetical protein